MPHQFTHQEQVFQVLQRILAERVSQRIGRHARRLEHVMQAVFGVRLSQSRQEHVGLMWIALAGFLEHFEGFARQGDAARLAGAVSGLVPVRWQTNLRRVGVQADLRPLQ